ncbi:MAG: hypothetical protein ACI4QN_01105, partial [Candidatus Coproplasma sp.]
MKNNSKEKDQGYMFRIIQAVLYMVILSYSIFIPLPSNIRIPIYCVVIVITVLQYVTVFVGRKAKWANVLSIILGILFIFYGVCGIIGGVKGIKTLKNSTEQTEQKTEEKKKDEAVKTTADVAIAKPFSPVKAAEIQGADFD